MIELQERFRKIKHKKDKASERVSVKIQEDKASKMTKLQDDKGSGW